MTDPWRNADGEPLEPSQVAADWLALWFWMCRFRYYHPATEPRLAEACFIATGELEALDRKRNSGTKSIFWNPQQFWPPLKENPA